MQVHTDTWNQFAGNAAGSGFRLVNSTRASALRWESSPAHPISGSPVLGPDGTIYIGTTNGQLVAVDPDHGSIKWKKAVAAASLAVQTPAVAEDGIIYCLCSAPGTVRDHRDGTAPRGLPSYVVAVNPDGSIRWQVPIRALPDELGSVYCEIYGAPRLVSGPRGAARLVFALRYTLVVPYPEYETDLPIYLRVLAIVDEHGSFLLFNRYEEKKIFIDAHGGGGIGGGAVISEPSAPGIAKQAHPCEDTPIVFGALPATAPWMIVVPGQYGLYRLYWNDEERSLARAPVLFPIDYAFPVAAAFPNGLVTGMAYYNVTLIGSDTFTSYLPHAASLDGPSTVAGGLRQMYFVTRYGNLTAIDANGSHWKRRSLNGGSVAFPALSANHVHVATTAGLQTFSLDLEDVSSLRLGNAGYASPAIAPGGDVYAAAGSTLYAFFDAAPRGRQTVRNLHPRRPARATHR